MRTEMVEIGDAQTRLKELVQKAISGVRVVLCEKGKPLAEIVPVDRPGARLCAGGIGAGDDHGGPLSKDLAPDGL